jgi:hypothetical protein
MPIRSTEIFVEGTKRISTSHPWATYRNVHRSTEEMYSINHFPLNLSGDDGGPWHLVRNTDVPTVGYHKNNIFDGEFVANKWDGWIYSAVTPTKTNSEMDSFGTTAIARSAPTNPAFEASTLVGETAFGGVPMVVGGSLYKERVRAARSAGSEYLNVEFGWLPLIRDIQKFARTVKDSDRILREYRKGSDVKIRKGYDGPTSEKTLTNVRTGFATQPSVLSGSGALTETHSAHQWFRGAFRYHIPTNDTQLGKFQQWASMSDHLLGWKVTPETVWNIAPWSWAADWFTNTGDIMANISNLGKDGLVMQYGYSMAHSRRDIEIIASYNTSRGRTTLTRRQITEYKQRRPATPYGFGTNLSPLTGKQIAVLSALGLSRL